MLYVADNHSGCGVSRGQVPRGAGRGAGHGGVAAGQPPARAQGHAPRHSLAAHLHTGLCFNLLYRLQLVIAIDLLHHTDQKG